MTNIVKAVIDGQKKTYRTEAKDFNRICMAITGTAPSVSEYAKRGMVRTATFQRQGHTYSIEVVSESAARDSASYFSDRPDLMQEIDEAEPLVIGSRPSQKETNVILRISEEQKMRWTEAATKQGRSLSDYIRAAVEGQI